MKSITMPVFRRPNYFKESLRHLSICKPQGYILYVGLEPGFPEMEEIASSIFFIKTKLVRNPKRMGMNWNNHNLVRMAFEEGSEFNITIEEDVAIAPDAILLAEWYFTLPDRDRYRVLGFINAHSNPKRPLDIKETHYFTPWGWCITKNAWLEHVSPIWMSDKKKCWSWSINDHLQKTGAPTLHPFLSRSNHIGREGGVNFSAETHDRAFSKVEMSSGGYGDNFKVVLR